MLKKNVITTYLILSLIIVSLGLGGCGSSLEQNGELKEKHLKVVTSFSILADVVENIVRDRGNVQYIVPIGENPEDYELLPGEMRMATDADIIFINGMGLEGSMKDAFARVTETPIISVTAGIKAIPLEGDDAPDPHAWLDAVIMMKYVENIMESIIELDPGGERAYRENTADYLLQLEELDAWIRSETVEIPENNRVIVVSENAYKYYGEAYGFQTEGIWELNSHEEGTPQQISRVVELVRNNQIPALFVETTVDQRYMETVSRETGVQIAGEVFTDALGPAGSGAETYIEMMKYNTRLFVEGLKN
ncbi:metal ABC transporter solute-binding protein, Zn/Mn family [Candidatus Contubernalis alkaliaceticus]|uniref:metal ABC transporter solute-binding protein, Zn/Mn family n=1 Tax=Candidatus Contubernalis alkaliaceticus TaxID=338645 RepID=UPI001F4C43D7|nr:zinc ABC transporter substrate-binding protein [Candidatus Contubernalis alkalaceticus]